MSKLNDIVIACKAGIDISINDHKCYYQDVIDWVLEELDHTRIQSPHDLEAIERASIELDIEKHTLLEMIKRDEVVRVHFFPHTPVGSYTVYHYDIDLALDRCLSILRGE